MFLRFSFLNKHYVDTVWYLSLRAVAIKTDRNLTVMWSREILKGIKKNSERRKGWFSVWSSYRVVRDLRYLRETAPFYTTVGTCFVQRMEEPRLSLSILQWGCILTTNTFVLVFFSSWNMLACRKIFSGKQHRWLLSQQSWMGIYCIAE